MLKPDTEFNYDLILKLDIGLVSKAKGHSQDKKPDSGT